MRFPRVILELEHDLKEDQGGEKREREQENKSGGLMEPELAKGCKQYMVHNQRQTETSSPRPPKRTIKLVKQLTSHTYKSFPGSGNFPPYNNKSLHSRANDS
uniref:Uncharacterized protein n=1 Tax=Timema bartmani TaxID=61472 RepID=A0A7R9EX63_9NEOP|nr:unnamed protein product [Timema bartmani]